MTTVTQANANEVYLQHSEKKKHYVQPDGVLAKLRWRAWIWLQTTFALSMMEAWEIIVIFCIVGIITLLLGVALVRYFPQTIITASHRALYYLSGSDSLDDIWVNGRVEL